MTSPGGGDYNLGKAQGTVEIKVNKKGIREAVGAMGDVQDANEDLGKSFDKSSRQAEGYEKSLHSLADQTDEMYKKDKELKKATDDLKKSELELDRVRKDSNSTMVEIAKQQERVNQSRNAQNKLLQEVIKLEREATAETQKLSAAIGAIPDSKKTKIDLDTRDANKKLHEFNQNMMAIKNMKKIVSVATGPAGKAAKAGAVGGALGAAGGAAGLLGAGGTGMAVQGITQLLGAAGQLSGVLGLIPGLAAGASFGIGTLKLATDGLADSFDAIGTDKFAESLRDLSGAGQEVMIAFNALNEPFKTFKQALQQDLLAGTAKWIPLLAEKYLPMIQQGMMQVTTAANFVIKDLADWANQTETFDTFKGILDDIGLAFRIAAPAARDLASAVLDILDVSASFLPDLARDFQGAATEFRVWIRELKDTGVMQQWIQTGIDAFKQLFNIVKIVGPALGQVFNIAQGSGATLLDFLEKAANTFSEWVNSAEGNTALTQFFESLRQASDALAPVLKVIGTTIVGTIIPMFADLGTAMAPAILDFFKSFADAMKALSPQIQAMGPGLSVMLTQLGGAFLSAIQQLAPLLPTFATAIGEVATSLANILKDPETLGNFIQSIQDALGRVGAFMENVEKIAQLGGDIAGGLIDAYSQIAGGVANVAGAIVTGGGKVLEFLDNLINVWPYKAGEGIANLFGTMVSETVGGAKVFWARFSDSVSGGWDIAVQWFKDLPGNIMEALGDLWQLGKDAGSKLINGLIQGIRDMIGNVGDAVSDVAQEIKDFIFGNSPTKKGPLSGSGWTYNAGAHIATALADGIVSGTGAVGAASEGMAQGVSDATDLKRSGGIQDLMNDLLELSSFGQKILSVFKQVADNVFNVLKFATTDLKTGKSTIPTKWVRNVSDEALAKSQADKAFSDSLDARYGTDKTPQTDVPVGKASGTELATQGKIPANATPEQVQAGIIAEGQRRGWSKDEIVAALATAKQESGFKFNATSSNGLWKGVFQQDSSYAGRDDAQKNIEAFADRLDKKRNSPGASDDPFSNIFWLQQRPGDTSADAAVANGRSGYMDEIKSQQADASKIYDQIIGNATSSGNVPVPDNPNKNAVSYYGGPDGKTPFGADGKPITAPVRSGTYGLKKGTDTGGYGNPTDAFPQWVMDLAKTFNVKPSTYASHQESDRNEAGYAPNPEHQNRGIDWSGSVNDMEKFAEALAKAAPNNPGLEQIIWQNPNTMQKIGLGGAGNPTTGYFPDTGDGSYQEHQNHVHTRQSTPVTIDGITAPAAQDMADPWIKAAPMTPEEAALLPDSRKQAIDDFQQSVGFDPTTGLQKAGTTPFADYTIDPNAPPGTGDNRPVTDDMLDAIAKNTDDTSSNTDKLLQEYYDTQPGLKASIDDMLAGKGSDEDIASGLANLDTKISDLQAQDTPQSRAQAQGLSGVQSDIAKQRGFGQAQNPIDQAAGMASSFSSVAGDVFKVVDSVLKSVSSADEITTTLVRGVENTEDINKIIDNVQTFIQLGADIAGAVSSVSGAIGAVMGAAGGADPTGGASGAAAAVQAVSAIAGIVQSALETVNAVIDLGQQAYKIGAKYFGKFLSYLTGGAGGSLEGDVKFLLDMNDQTLKNWSEDNPEDKRSHGIPAWMQDEVTPNGSKIRDLNVYMGAGQDPAETMNQAMWLVSTDSQGVFSGGNNEY